MLENNGRNVKDEESGLDFKTPDEWYKSDVAIRQEYRGKDNTGLLFDRQYKAKDAMQRVIGIGHRLFDMALEQAKRQTVSVTLVPEKFLQRGLFVFRVSDRVTTKGMRSSILFVVEKSSEQTWNILPDWKFLLLLNDLFSDRGLWKRRVPVVNVDAKSIMDDAKRATQYLNESFGKLHLDFNVPASELIGVIVPGTTVTEKEMTDIIEASD